MNEHIFIDLDGTVWDLSYDSKNVLSEIYKEVSENNKLPDFEVFYNNYNIINLGLWEEYKKHKITRQTLEEKRFRDTLSKIGVFEEEVFNKISKGYLNNLPLKTTLFSDVVDVLSKLSVNYKLHIITNGFKEIQYRKLQDTGLINFFTNIFISEELGMMKPDLKLYYYAIEKSGSKIKKSYMIGDDINADLIPARDIGIKQIYFNPLQLSNENKFTLTVSSWLEIYRYFEKKLVLLKDSNSVDSSSYFLP